MRTTLRAVARLVRWPGGDMTVPEFLMHLLVLLALMLAVFAVIMAIITNV